MKKIIYTIKAVLDDGSTYRFPNYLPLTVNELDSQVTAGRVASPAHIVIAYVVCCLRPLPGMVVDEEDPKAAIKVPAIWSLDMEAFSLMPHLEELGTFTALHRNHLAWT